MQYTIRNVSRTLDAALRARQGRRQESLAVQHNLVLYTRDEHFNHLPQLRLL